MEIDWQLFVNGILMVGGCIIGWFVKRVFETLDKHEETMTKLADKQQVDYVRVLAAFTELSVKLPENYATKPELTQVFNHVNQQLANINKKLDTYIFKTYDKDDDK